MPMASTAELHDYILSLIPKHPQIMQMSGAGQLADIPGFLQGRDATYPDVETALLTAQEEFLKIGKFIGYRLTRERTGGWMFLGVDPKEIGAAFANEIDSESGLDLEDRDCFKIEAFEITQKEIDEMPEFQGW